MQGLLALARPDLDRLGDTDLDVRRDFKLHLTTPALDRRLQDLPCRLDEKRVQCNLDHVVGTVEQPPHATGPAAGEVFIITARDAFQQWQQVPAQACKGFRIQEVFDGDATVGFEDSDDFFNSGCVG
ncbi:hypothetical protein D9M68_781340 [compost metagenome]